MFLKTGIFCFSLEICFSAKTKVVQLVKPNNFLCYSFIRFLQKTDLPDLTVSGTNLGMTISLLLERKPIYQQRQMVFTWLSPTTLSVTALYVFLRKPDLPHLTISAQILLEETDRETPVAAERPQC
jgi:hypothetical protein